jgi:hypothetical protein
MLKVFNLFFIFLIFSGCSIENLDEAIIILEKNNSFEPSKFEMEVKNISNISKELIINVPVEDISLNNSLGDN